MLVRCRQEVFHIPMPSTNTSSPRINLLAPWILTPSTGSLKCSTYMYQIMINVDITVAFGVRICSNVASQVILCVRLHQPDGRAGILHDANLLRDLPDGIVRCPIKLDGTVTHADKQNWHIVTSLHYTFQRHSTHPCTCALKTRSSDSIIACNQNLAVSFISSVIIQCSSCCCMNAGLAKM